VVSQKAFPHLRATTEEELLAVSRRRLHSAIAHGTTTIEIKSGYGLDLENELKQLRVVRALAQSHPVVIVPTFLGGHAIPPEYRQKREDYVRLLTDVMIPAVVGEKLAEFNDVFCETGAFSREETEQILRSGQRAGLKARIHAEELTDTGGAVLAAELGAASADHLKKIGPEGINRMAAAGVFGVLLPGTSFGLPRSSLHPRAQCWRRACGLPSQPISIRAARRASRCQ
jgi:imidazolonepropionase